MKKKNGSVLMLNNLRNVPTEKKDIFIVNPTRCYLGENIYYFKKYARSVS